MAGSERGRGAAWLSSELCWVCLKENRGHRGGAGRGIWDQTPKMLQDEGAQLRELLSW